MDDVPAGLEGLYTGIDNVSGLIWGGTWNGAQVLVLPPMVVILLGVGLWMMIGLRFYPILKLGSAFAGLFRKQGASEGGEISPFAALSTALSGQVGTGNLAGVATAITLGGPGALFWMWVTALLGMALAFAEGSLAVRYRDRKPDGRTQGGPMHYIRKGLGPRWRWLAAVFSVGLLFSSFVTGNMIQANAFADSVFALTGWPEWLGGLLVAGVTFAVIVGGIKSIGAVAERIVPFMAVSYVLMAFVALMINFEDLPASFVLIFDSAFNGQAATGGFLGAGMIMAIRAGVARGLFSNEAGQGSTPIAHAVAKTDEPAKQGRFAMMGTFIDTIIICTATGLVLLTVQGAFPHAAGGAGAVQEHVWTWRLGDIANATMALPNLVALALLSGVVFAMARGEHKAGRDHE